MRDLKRNQQTLKYATYNEQIKIYETDSAGNIIHDEIDGELVPRIKSEIAGYNNPVSFDIECATSGGNAEAVAFGVEIGSYQAVLTTVDKLLPIDEKTLIWQNTEPIYKADGTVDSDSADYSVLSVKPSIDGMKYLLKKLTKGSD